MMSQALAVFLCCLVSSVICVEVDDNLAVTENSLQELTLKKNTSGSEDNNTFIESKSNLELKTILTKDIKRKIDDLKELKNAFKRVETDFFGDNSKSPHKSDNLSVRTIREYPFNKKERTYQNQNFNSKLSNDEYINRKYKYNHYPETYENTELRVGVQGDPNEVVEDKSLHTEEGMQHMIQPFVTTSPVAKSLQPVHSTSTLVEPHKPLYITGQNPHEVHIHQVTPYYSQVPLFYANKEISLPGTFFGKQITLGPFRDFGNGFSNNPSGNKPLFGYSYGEISYPYASLPCGYANGAYKYYTDFQFYKYPEAQPYYFGSFYNPDFYYQQAHPNTYYSAAALSHGKKNFEYKSQKQLDGLLSLSQISEDDSSRRDVLSAVDKNPLLDQLEDIKTDEKKVTLQDLSPSSSDDKDSFISWLNGEVNNLYSRWMRLKEDMKSEEVSFSKLGVKGEPNA